MTEQQTNVNISEASTAQGSPDYEFRPFQSPYLEDPFPFLMHYRQERPAFFSPMVHMWIISRYDDIQSILKDPQRFSSREAFAAPAHLSPAAMQLLKGTMFTSEAGGLVMADPPVHTRLRRTLTNAFTSKRVAQLEDQIRTLANSLVDAFPAFDPVDFAESFARPLPVMAICRLIGMPDSDGDWIRRSTDDLAVLLTQPLPEEEQKRCAQLYLDLFQYMDDLLKERRLAPRDDLATALQGSDAGQLSNSELIELLITLLTAGIASTTHFLSACLLHLLQQGIWSKLGTQSDYLARVVEEALRLVSPIQGIFRTAREEVQFGSVTVPAGAMIYGVLTSANHDEQQFQHPDAFDLDRGHTNRHMVFGYGIHYCAGAPLVRLESRVALEVLRQRFPQLHLIADHPPISYTPGLLLRGIEHVFIERA